MADIPLLKEPVKNRRATSSYRRGRGGQSTNDNIPPLRNRAAKPCKGAATLRSNWTGVSGRVEEVGGSPDREPETIREAVRKGDTDHPRRAEILR